MLWSMMCKTPVILLVVSFISTLVISLISAVLPKAVAIINRSVPIRHHRITFIGHK